MILAFREMNDCCLWERPKKKYLCRLCARFRWGGCEGTVMCPPLRKQCQRNCWRALRATCKGLTARTLQHLIVAFCLNRGL